MVVAKVPLALKVPWITLYPTTMIRKFCCALEHSKVWTFSSLSSWGVPPFNNLEQLTTMAECFFLCNKTTRASRSHVVFLLGYLWHQRYTFFTFRKPSHHGHGSFVLHQAFCKFERFIKKGPKGQVILDIIVTCEFFVSYPKLIYFLAFTKTWWMIA